MRREPLRRIDRTRLVAAAVLAALTVLPLAGAGTPAAAGTVAPAAAPTPAPEPAFRIADAEVTESSALAISRSQPGLAYTVNDSGDTARVFSVDMSSGAVVGRTRLAGVQAVDVEALAAMPDGRLLVADVGDNDSERPTVAVYVIDEPGHGDSVADPLASIVHYPDGPHDAEAVLVLDGDLVVVTKAVFGAAVYRASFQPGLPVRLRMVAPAPSLVTDATVLGDGRPVLRTYVSALVMDRDWRVQRRITLPPMAQGESLAADPRRPVLYAGTEGVDSPVYRIRVGPAEPTPDRTPGPTSSPSTTASPAASTPEAAGSPAPDQGRDDSGAPPAWTLAGGAVALLVLLVGGWLVSRAAARRSRRTR